MRERILCRFLSDPLRVNVSNPDLGVNDGVAELYVRIST